jgi:hypothetical protein
MNPSNSTPASVSVTADGLARAVTEQLLQPRRVYLHRKAPRSAYVHSLRRKMASGAVQPVFMLLSAAMADLEDGIPLPLVLQAWHSAIAVLTEYANTLPATRTTDVLPIERLLPLVQRENRMQAEKDAAERHLIANPESVDAHDRLLAADALYDSENDRLVAAVRARRGFLTLVETAS